MLTALLHFHQKCSWMELVCCGCPASCNDMHSMLSPQTMQLDLVPFAAVCVLPTLLVMYHFTTVVSMHLTHHPLYEGRRKCGRRWCLLPSQVCC